MTISLGCLLNNIYIEYHWSNFQFTRKKHLVGKCLNELRVDYMNSLTTEYFLILEKSPLFKALHLRLLILIPFTDDQGFLIRVGLIISVPFETLRPCRSMDEWPLFRVIYFSSLVGFRDFGQIRWVFKFQQSTEIIGLPWSEWWLKCNVILYLIALC